MFERVLDAVENVRRADRAEQWRRPVDEEKAAVAELVEEGFLSGAGYGAPLAFEERFADAVDADYCLAVDHGTTALASAYYAVGVGPGDEVVTPTVGFIGSYAGAMHLGARPVFCDVDPDTLLADPEDAEERITDRTRAINLVHTNGRVCDMDAFRELADRHDVPLVVDASHAHGATWGDEPVGSVGDVTCFSLQGVLPHGKPVAAGEGGIVTTDDRELYERQLSYCHLHRDGVVDELTGDEYRHLDEEVLGLKFRAHPLALAVADVSLDSLEYRVRRRTEFRTRLFEHLERIEAVDPVETYEKSDTGGLVDGVAVTLELEALPDGVDATGFASALRDAGVPADAGFAQLEHRRDIFTEGYDLWGDDRGPLGGPFCGLPAFEPYAEGDLPRAERLDRRVLSLPSFIEPRAGLLDEYVAGFEEVVAGYRR